MPAQAGARPLPSKWYNLAVALFFSFFNGGLVMSFRAIFSDIDGTLLTSEHQISSRTLSVLHQVVAKQIPVVLVSARPPMAIEPFSKQIGGDNALIAFNGALILDSQLNALYSVTLAHDDVQRLEALLEAREGVYPNYYYGTQWYSSEPSNYWTTQEGDITHLRASQKPERLEGAHKILVMGEAPAILALEAELKPLFPHLEIHRSKTTYLEIVNKAATKSQAIQFMEKRLGLKGEEVVAFGDNYNDLDMLRYAGYSVAMGNAPDDIKAQASYVTASNNDDGMALVLERLLAEGKLSLV